MEYQGVVSKWFSSTWKIGGGGGLFGNPKSDDVIFGPLLIGKIISNHNMRIQPQGYGFWLLWFGQEHWNLVFIAYLTEKNLKNRDFGAKLPGWLGFLSPSLIPDHLVPIKVLDPIFLGCLNIFQFQVLSNGDWYSIQKCYKKIHHSKHGEVNSVWLNSHFGCNLWSFFDGSKLPKFFLLLHSETYIFRLWDKLPWFQHDNKPTGKM